ncbi:MAG: hypothetical protein KDB74_04940 [Flavobacteriales bacterium]|nr:hypothetical protein [Flavobacteriales bacterium]
MRSKLLFIFLSFLFFNTSILAQDDYEYEIEDTSASRFSIGINVGAFFANNNTAILYSGSPRVTNYGINYIFNRQDLKQTFDNYFVHPYSIDEYPIESSYKTTAELGIHLGYQFSNLIAAFIEFNSIQLKYEQYFTVAIRDPQNSNTLEPYRYEKFPIYGEESRFNLNMGTQISYFHENETNAYLALFGNINGVKLKRNYFILNQIEYEIQHPIDNDFNRKPGGIGYGVGGGLGLKFSVSEKIIADIYYNLYYTQTNLTEFLNTYSYNHSIGLRILWKKQKTTY